MMGVYGNNYELQQYKALFFFMKKLKGCHERKKKSFHEMLGSNLFIVSETKREYY